MAGHGGGLLRTVHSGGGSIPATESGNEQGGRAGEHKELTKTSDVGLVETEGDRVALAMSNGATRRRATADMATATSKGWQ